jgi:molybdopterin synthase sulfur carrier subunit
MATVNLIYFGSVTDVTGIQSEEIESPATLNELSELLISRFPGLSALNYRFSVNRKLTSENPQLADGDEIALLPPFAGG